MEHPVHQNQLTQSNLHKVQSFVVPATAIRAEILWVLKVVITHSSLQFCENLNELFQAMFNVQHKIFKLGKTKCGYFINYGLALFFKTNLIKSIKESPFFATFLMKALIEYIRMNKWMFTFAIGTLKKVS